MKSTKRISHIVEQDQRRFRFYRGWLMIASAVFALQGMIWIALGSFDPFGIWDRWMFATLFDGKEHSEVVRFRHFILGPFGATLSGFFILVLGIVYFGFPQKQAWTYWTVVAGIATWFCIDCGSCAYHGAWFNIVIVNIPCLIVLGIPLAGIRNSFTVDNSS